MSQPRFGRPRILRAAAAAVLAGLVAGCGSGPPAPVILNGAAPGMAGDGPAGAMPGAMPRALTNPVPKAMPALRENRRIVVQRGQSLGRIAQEYRVSERAIIAANNLKPPYKIETGQNLLIPGAGAPLSQAKAAPPAGAGRPPPEIIPLDGPAPGKSIAFPPAASAPAEPPAIAGSQRPPPGPPHGAAESARAEAAKPAPSSKGSPMPWPVQGRVLAGYGVAAGGAHNDGINIAAPRGAPVRAVDGGVVAYAGNEVRGYGNLVLVKHANGFISAYAHLEELLVKRDEQVKRGQVIAKVGATGGVGEPQLHFELRRDKRAVDPREFLAPTPSAGSKGVASPG